MILDETKPRASRFPALLATLSIISMAFLLTACRAPGMKMDLSGLDKDSTVRMNGQQVTLRPLNAP